MFLRNCGVWLIIIDKKQAILYELKPDPLLRNNSINTHVARPEVLYTIAIYQTADMSWQTINKNSKICT